MRMLLLLACARAFRPTAPPRTRGLGVLSSTAEPAAAGPVEIEPLPVLYETADFAVVAKPAGIMVHRNKFSRKDEHGVALLQLVRDQLGRHVNPVHRLDGGTSGCLIFAFDGFILVFIIFLVIFLIF